jgi:ATP-dependent Clp protease ATP-binding subunit ClpC
MLDHDYIGTEHILLGLIHEGEGVAAQALTTMGIGLEAVRGQVEQIIGKGQAKPAGHIPFTPRAKKVLELALREALQLGHNYIGTEHILLGVLREGEGVAAQVLQKLGADLNRVRQAVIRRLGEMGQGPSVALQEEVEGETERRGPRCPRCDADLAVFATYRTITVPDEEESATRKAAFVFCRSCSYTLGMLPE